MYQTSGGIGVKRDDPTVIKLILDYIRPSTIVVAHYHCKIVQDFCLEKHGRNLIKAMEEIATYLQQIKRKGKT